MLDPDANPTFASHTPWTAGEEASLRFYRLLVDQHRLDDDVWSAAVDVDERRLELLLRPDNPQTWSNALAREFESRGG
jgi:hypothetical protein